MPSENNTSEYNTKHLKDTFHVWKRPDTYIGSTRRLKRQYLGYDPIDKKFLNIECDTPVGVQRCFLEIISNAGDNADNSRRKKINPGPINVEMNETTISIENFGKHMPVERMTLEEKGGEIVTVPFKGEDSDWVWIPELNFGKLRSGTNYDDNVKNMGCGRNGFGSKLCNIFSKRFKVIVEDPTNKRRFIGVWKDNMFKDNNTIKPEIKIEEDKSIKGGRVKIEWDIDFEYFRMKKYDVNDFLIFARYTADFSFSCKIITKFNGTEIDMRDIKTLASLVWPEEKLKNSFIHYIWEKDAPENLINSSPKTQGKTIIEAKDHTHIPELEIMVIDTPDESMNFFYANGLMTPKGGEHVDAVSNNILTYIGDIVKKKREKHGISNRFNVKKHVKTHLSIILNARLHNPEFDSQCKELLIHPKVEKVFYPENMLKKIDNWDIIQRVNAEMEALDYTILKKDDGKKQRYVDVKGASANFAGTKDSLKCTLFLTEGDSASVYIDERITQMQIPGEKDKLGKDYFGFEPLRGKILNVTNAKLKKYADNAVIGIIKKVMGLQEGMDYSVKENVKTLRYGRVVVAADSDADGAHILTLIINFFREKFPAIIKNGMFGYLRVPLVKVRRGNTIVQRFFTEKEFNSWRVKNDTKGLSIKYYKGLGTALPEDIPDDLEYAPTVMVFYDDNAEDNMGLAFHKKKVYERKKWMEGWKSLDIDDIVTVNLKDTDQNLLKIQQVSEIINTGLIDYSVSTLFRMIPSEYDFLKECQRKAIYVALNCWNYSNKSSVKEMKTFQFASKVALEAYYHHGDKSMNDNVTKLTQNFVGSNNLNYFQNLGQFGNRTELGKNAASPRYTSVKLNWWLPLVFHKESIELINRRIIDDELAEPEWLPSVIPIGLINGFNGIATGFSSFSPNHNPFDCIDWIRKKLKGEKTDPILPWYNGYTMNNEIEITEKKKKKEDEVEIEEDDDLEEELLPDEVPNEEEDEEEDEEVDLNENFNKIKNIQLLKHIRECDKRMATFGRFDVIGVEKGYSVIKVSELPIGVASKSYLNWLESLAAERSTDKVVSKVSDKSKSTNHPVFEVHWNAALKPINIKNLKLVRRFGISNITLINNDGFPSQYKDTEVTLEIYYKHMIEHYTLLKQSRLDIQNEKIRDTSFLCKFISAVLKNEITIWKEEDGKRVPIDEKIVEEQMNKLEIPMKYYDSSKVKDFSKESLIKYKEKIKECKAIVDEIQKTTPESIWEEKLNKLEEELKKRFVDGSFEVTDVKEKGKGKKKK